MLNDAHMIIGCVCIGITVSEPCISSLYFTQYLELNTDKALKKIYKINKKMRNTGRKAYHVGNQNIFGDMLVAQFFSEYKLTYSFFMIFDGTKYKFIKKIRPYIVYCT